MNLYILKTTTPHEQYFTKTNLHNTKNTTNELATLNRKLPAYTVHSTLNTIFVYTVQNTHLDVRSETKTNDERVSSI